MRDQVFNFKIDQKKETPVTSMEGKFPLRYAYARANETQKDNDNGQDYMTYQIQNNTMVFAICDGVSLSFFGDLSAKFLGDRACEWLLYNTYSKNLNKEMMQTEFTRFLQEIVEDGTRMIREFHIPDEVTGILRDVLEDKRNHGSETTFVCGRIDLADGSDSEGSLFIAWLGDSRLRLWKDDEEKTSLLGDTFHTSQRWSTSKGPVGGKPHVFIKKLSEQDMINRVVLYSDGLSGLDSYQTLPDDQTIQRLIDAAGRKPTSDDISFLDISLTSLKPTSNFKTGLKNFFRRKGEEDMVQKVTFLQLSDKELFFLGSLIGIESIVGLEDPFIGYLVEEIQEEWETISKEMLIKGYLTETQHGLQLEDRIRDIISACGSAQIIRFYLENEHENIEKYFYINNDVVVEKSRISSELPFYQLKLFSDRDEIWLNILPFLEASGESSISERTIKFQVTDEIFQKSRELVSQNKLEELESLLSQTNHNEIFINDLTSMKGEGQITLMNWDGEYWEVTGKAFLKSTNHNWLINFINEVCLELIIKSMREISQEFYQIIKLVR